MNDRVRATGALRDAHLVADVAAAHDVEMWPAIQPGATIAPADVAAAIVHVHVEVLAGGVAGGVVVLAGFHDNPGDCVQVLEVDVDIVLIDRVGPNCVGKLGGWPARVASGGGETNGVVDEYLGEAAGQRLAGGARYRRHVEDVVVGVEVSHFKSDQVVLLVNLNVADREIGGSRAGVVRLRKVEVPPVDIARVEAGSVQDGAAVCDPGVQRVPGVRLGGCDEHLNSGEVSPLSCVLRSHHIHRANSLRRSQVDFNPRRGLTESRA